MWREPKRWAAAAVAGLMFSGSTASGAFITTGTYDEQATNTNAVDREETGNPNSLSQFTTDVANAFANDRGGVIDFDGVGESAFDSGDDITATYGTSGSKSLDLDTSIATLNVTNNSVAANAISGGQGLFNFDSNNNTLTFTFGSIAGGDPNEVVNEAGFTLLSAAFTDGSYSATANFSDGTSDARNITLGDSDDDLFVHFAAPTGESINSITVNDGDGRAAIDDFAFSTVIPEPASLALIGLGGLGLLPRRQRIGED